MRTRKRLPLLGTFTLLALVSVFWLPPVVANGQELREPALACPPGAVPESAFTDSLATVHSSSIQCMAWYELTAGKSDTTFSPGRRATRGQIATLLVRLLREAGAELPEPSDQGFRDVAGTAHEDAINQLAELGIIFGFGDGRFRPSAPVQRGQFAALLFRLHEHVTGEEFSQSVIRFRDVAGTTHEEAINALAAEEIVVGFRDGAFRPSAHMTRGQLTSFLIRHMDLFVGEGLIATPIGMPTSRFFTALSWLGEVDTPAGEEPHDPRFGQGEDEAVGSAVLTLFADDGFLCYRLRTEAGASPGNEIVGAHIHVGEFAENGPVAVALDLPEPVRDGDTQSSGCTDELEPGYEGIIDAIEADPHGHYVNVHTNDHPAGAVRGQLGATSHFLVALSWLNVLDIDPDDRPVFGQGEPGAGGEAYLQLFIDDPVAICAALRTDAQTGTGASLHEGALDELSPVAVPFDWPFTEGADGFRWSASCVPQDEFAEGYEHHLSAVRPGPAMTWYVQIHSSEFPHGAVRGQLPRGGQDEIPPEQIPDD